MDKRRDRGKSVVSVKLFVEGGGARTSQRTACRKGFRIFIEKAELSGRMPGIVACGTRRDAYERFKFHIQNVKDSTAILLVDSEDPIRAKDPWQHLEEREHDSWERPSEASNDQCHFMVQVMESWFLADKNALGEFYGQGFRESALPANPQIEEISKKDVLDGLGQAARETAKRRYDKGSHGFDILATLDPAKIQEASPHAKCFIETLMQSK